MKALISILFAIAIQTHAMAANVTPMNPVLAKDGLFFQWKNAFALGQERGGGDEIGLEVRKTANVAIVKLEQQDFLSSAAIEQLRDTLKESIIIMTDDKIEIPINGTIQDSVAENSSATKIIKVNRQRWVKIADEALQEALILHELLGLLQVEPTGSYPISSKYLTYFGFPELSTVIGKESKVMRFICQSVLPAERSPLITTVVYDIDRGTPLSVTSQHQYDRDRKFTVTHSYFNWSSEDSWHDGLYLELRGSSSQDAYFNLKVENHASVVFSYKNPKIYGMPGDQSIEVPTTCAFHYRGPYGDQ